MAEYDYRDESGSLLYQVIRKVGKDFRQRRPNGEGGWEWKLNGTRRVPYRLQELLASDPSAPVFILEGEKDVETARELGIIATCNPGGAGKWASVADVARTILLDRDVVILADADAVGRRHAQQIFQSLRQVAKSAVIIEAPAPHKDFTDWILAGGTVPDVLAVVRAQVPAAPESEVDAWREHFHGSEEETRGPAFQILDGPAIAAPMPPIEYICEQIGLVAGGGAPHLLAGYGFSGKTVAAQSMALSLAAGRAVWGVHKCPKARVLQVDLEQGERLTRSRYQRIAIASGIDLTTLGDDISLVAMAPITLASDRMSQWRDLMAGRQLVIVDSLRAATSGADENDSSIRGALDMLGSISEDTKCRALVIHHARKPSSDSIGGAVYTIRGSSAIFDACDSVYVFSAEKGEPISVEHVKARSHGEPVPDWALVISDVEIGTETRAGLSVTVSGVELVTQRREAKVESTKKAQAARDAMRVIAAVAARHDGIGSVELRELCGLSGHRLALAVGLLTEQQKVTMEREGKRRVYRARNL